MRLREPVSDAPPTSSTIVVRIICTEYRHAKRGAVHKSTTGASLRAEILSYAFARRVMRRAIDAGFSLTSGADDLC